MSWLVAGTAGAVLGLAYFGGLWLTVVGVVRQPSRAVWVPVGSVARLLLLGLGLGLVSRQGSGGILAALVGLWLSRWYLLHRIGAARHGR